MGMKIHFFCRTLTFRVHLDTASNTNLTLLKFSGSCPSHPSHNFRMKKVLNTWTLSYLDLSKRMKKQIISSLSCSLSRRRRMSLRYMFVLKFVQTTSYSDPWSGSVISSTIFLSFLEHTYLYLFECKGLSQFSGHHPAWV